MTLKEEAAEFQALLVKMESGTVTQEKGVAKSAAEKITKIVADDRTDRGGNDQQNDIESMRRARVDCSGNQSRLAGSRNPHALDTDDSGHNPVAMCREQMRDV